MSGDSLRLKVSRVQEKGVEATTTSSTSYVLISVRITHVFKKLHILIIALTTRGMLIIAGNFQRTKLQSFDSKYTVCLITISRNHPSETTFCLAKCNRVKPLRQKPVNLFRSLPQRPVACWDLLPSQFRKVLLHPL